MSYTLFETEDLESGSVGEDFELSVLENAYRSGTMQRLTGIPAGAPASTTPSLMQNGVESAPSIDSRHIAGSALFAEDVDPFDTLQSYTNRLPIDERISKDENGVDSFGDDDESTKMGKKRRRDVGEVDEEDAQSSCKTSKPSKDSNKSHTRRCREKVNDKFKQLLEELPSPQSGMEVQHKAQILDYTIRTLKDLSNRKTSLETELAFSSKKNLLRWVDNVITNAKTFPDAVRPFLDMFCTKKGWKYAELWLPTKGNMNTNQPQSEMVLRLKKWVLNRSLGNVDREKLDMFGTKSEAFEFNPRVGVPGRVFSTLRPEWLPKLDNDETFVRSSLASEFGLNVCLAVPVVIRGQVAAVTVFFDTEVRDYDADCLDLAIDIASLTGNAYGAKSVC
mmetsp:Transcript_3239/g.9887  ORF Transcript_3239/g.9887 Transcript_3239/m.9887 type:complete len:392 (-) Transcript_3239:164-1339(-)